MSSSSTSSCIPPSPRDNGVQPISSRTELESCARKIGPEVKLVEVMALLANLLHKDLLPRADIIYSRDVTLKTISITAISNQMMPKRRREQDNYINNIHQIYTELIDRRTPLEPEEKHLFKTFERCYAPLRIASMVDRIPETDSSEHVSEKCLIDETKLETSPRFTTKPPLQQLLWKLNPNIPLSQMYSKTEHLHPRKFLLGYKSCITTEELFDQVYIALGNDQLSKREKKHLNERIVTLMQTWFRMKIFNYELQDEIISIKFRDIISRLSKIDDSSISYDVFILKTLWESSQILSPRTPRKSESLFPVDTILEEVSTARTRDQLLIIAKRFADEVTTFFLNYLLEVPLEEYFIYCKPVEKTPSLHQLIGAINNFELWGKRRFSYLTKKCSRSQIAKFLITSMTVARKQREYQTAFSISNIYSEFMKGAQEGKRPIKLRRYYRNEIEEINNLFSLEHNFKHLRKEYYHHNIRHDKYLPLISCVMKDLMAITEVPIKKNLSSSSSSGHYQEDTNTQPYNLERFHYIYTTLHPIFQLMKHPRREVALTNLNFKVMCEPLTEEFFSSTPPSFPSGKLQSQLHRDLQEY